MKHVSKFEWIASFLSKSHTKSNPSEFQEPAVSIAIGTNMWFVCKLIYLAVFNNAVFSAAAQAASDVYGR